MPISDPIYNAFKLYIPPNWVYPEVRDLIIPKFRQLDFPFESIEAYLNSTIVNGTLPGLEDNGSKEQVHSQGRTKTFRSSALPKESADKILPITFKLKDNFLNWVIMYQQMIAYLDHKNGSYKAFMPPIFMHILDENGYNFISMIYGQLQFRKVPPLDFNKSDRGILTREFTVNFKFNDFDIDFKIDNKSNYTKPEYKY